jgi:hypothetical protein
VLAAAAVGCSGPDGSGQPSAEASARGVAFTPAPASSGVPARSAALGSIGGEELEVTAYSVDEALAAEGGEAVGAMLDDLGISADDVELSLAVAPGGDPAISDWLLPGASASEILAAWEQAAPGSWTTDELEGAPALVGNGPDGTRAWAFSRDDRFVYVRTDDRHAAEEVAAALGS